MSSFGKKFSGTYLGCTHSTKHHVHTENCRRPLLSLPEICKKEYLSKSTDIFARAQIISNHIELGTSLQMGHIDEKQDYNVYFPTVESQ